MEEGAAPDEQLQNLLMQQQNEIYSLTESKGMLQASIVDLCSLLNIDNTDGFDIIQDDDTDMYLENSIENIINSAMTLPQIEVVNQKLLSAKYAIKIAKSDLYPSLSFNSSYSSSYSSTRRQVAFDENGTPIIVDGAIAYKNYPFINQIYDNRTAIFGFNLNIPILSAFHVKRKSNYHVTTLNNYNTRFKMWKRMSKMKSANSILMFKRQKKSIVPQWLR